MVSPYDISHYNENSWKGYLQIKLMDILQLIMGGI